MRSSDKQTIIYEVEAAIIEGERLFDGYPHAINDTTCNPKALEDRDWERLAEITKTVNQGVKNLIKLGDRVPPVLLQSTSILERYGLMLKRNEFFTYHKELASGEFDDPSDEPVKLSSWSAIRSQLVIRHINGQGKIIPSIPKINIVGANDVLHLRFDADPKRVGGAFAKQPLKDWGWTTEIDHEQIKEELELDGKKIEGFVRRLHRLGEFARKGSGHYQQGQLSLISEWRGRHGSSEIANRLSFNDLGGLLFSYLNIAEPISVVRAKEVQEEISQMISERREVIRGTVLNELRSPEPKRVRGGRLGTNPSVLYR